MSFDAPEQLRVTYDLDTTSVKLSARAQALAPAQLSMGWVRAVAGLASVFTVSGVYVLAVVALIVAAVLYMFAARPTDEAPGRQDVRLVMDSGCLKVCTDEGIQKLDWTRVGRVRVEGGADPELVVRVAMSPDVRIPMELEPVEHAVWLADAIENRAREARKRAGTVADVPRALDKMRG